VNIVTLQPFLRAKIANSKSRPSCFFVLPPNKINEIFLDVVTYS